MFFKFAPWNNLGTTSAMHMNIFFLNMHIDFMWGFRSFYDGQCFLTCSISESCFLQHILRNNPPVQFRLTHMAQAHATLPAFVPHLVDQTGQTQLWLVHCSLHTNSTYILMNIFHCMLHCVYVLAYLFWSDYILHIPFIYFIFYNIWHKPVYCSIFILVWFYSCIAFINIFL